MIDGQMQFFIVQLDKNIQWKVYLKNRFFSNWAIGKQNANEDSVLSIFG